MNVCDVTRDVSRKTALWPRAGRSTSSNHSRNDAIHDEREGFRPEDILIRRPITADKHVSIHTTTMLRGQSASSGWWSWTTLNVTNSWTSVSKRKSRVGFNSQCFYRLKNAFAFHRCGKYNLKSSFLLMFWSWRRNYFTCMCTSSVGLKPPFKSTFQINGEKKNRTTVRQLRLQQIILLKLTSRFV